MKHTAKLALCTLLGAPFAPAATLLEVNYSFVNDGDTLSDGTRVEDVSGNGYHGFWGDAAGTYPVVTTPTGTGLDTTSTTRGHVFHRDSMTGVPTAWDGGTTTVTPYFTLDGGTLGSGSFTFEAVVNWNGATSTRNGLMGQTGGAQAWLREDGGFLHYAFGVEGALDANMFANTIDISAAKADSNYHGIAVVYDGINGEIRSYLDGVLLHTNTDANIGNLGTLLSGTTDFRTGAYNTSDPAAFNGIQDQFRISDTALTPGQFLAIPEPSSIALLGLAGLGFLRRRR